MLLELLPSLLLDSFRFALSFPLSGLRPTAPYCALLRPTAPYCTLLRPPHSPHSPHFHFASSQHSLTINATGAILRMRKLEYLPPRYAVGEWRHLLSIRGASGVSVIGGTWIDAGGDGMYIADDHSTEGSNASCDVLLEGVRVVGAWRNGLSVISAMRLRVKDSSFTDTNGTNPQCGVDLEPDLPTHRLQGIVFSNITLARNRRCGFSMGPYALVQSGEPIDVTVEGIRIVDIPGTTKDANLPPSHPPITDHGGVGIVLADGYNLSGKVNFTDVTVTNVLGEGEIYIHCYRLIVIYKASL